MGHWFFSGKHHVPKGCGHSEHFVVMTVLEVSFDGGREAVDLLFEMDGGSVVFELLKRFSEPYMGGELIWPCYCRVAGILMFNHVYGLDSGAHEGHHGPNGVLPVNHPAIEFVSAVQCGGDEFDGAELI